MSHRFPRSVWRASVAVGVVCGLLSVGLTAAHATATTYYVDPAGDDSASGLSLLAPFRTIQRCATVATAGDTCEIRAGVYRETVRPASGSAGAPITFRPYAGEKVTVSGADPVTGQWSLASAEDLAIQERGAGGFEAGVTGGKIWRAPVVMTQTDMHGSTGRWASGTDRRGSWANQVLVNGQMVPEARWPNGPADLLAPTKAVAGALTTPHVIEDAALTHPAGFWTGAMVHLMGGYEWTAATAWVEAYAPGALTHTHNTNMFAVSSCSSYCAKPGNRYFLTGILGALDAPGEWYYDYTRQTIWLWSPDGSPPAGVETKQRELAFDLRGRSHITVQGISLVAATIHTDTASSHNVLDGLSARYLSHTMQWTETETLELTGIVLDGTDNVLRNSALAFSGGNIVTVRGKRNVVTNNLISHANYTAFFPGAGVFIQNRDPQSTGSAATVTNNTIHTTGGAGLVVTTWPNLDATRQHGNRVAYNDIFNANVFQQDQGAIEAFDYSAVGGLDLTGTRFDHNLLHDNLAKNERHRTNAYGGVGIYLDLAGYNSTIDHNVAWNNGGDGLRTNGDATVTPVNNLLYNNTAGGGQERSFGSYVANGGHGGSRFVNNIFRGPTEILDGAHVEANRTPDDPAPGFVDEAKYDFHLAAGGPAVDAGVALPPTTDGFTGAAPDQGAYEHGVDWDAGCTFAACRLSLVDDTDARFSWTGSWSHCTTGCNPDIFVTYTYAADREINPAGYLAHAFPYSGTYSASSQAGDVATVTFTGTGVTLHGQKAPDGGLAAVSLDGGTERIVDLFTEISAGDQLLFHAEDLAPGTHTASVRVLGDRNRRSSGHVVRLDRMTVTGEPAPVTPVVDPVRTKKPRPSKSPSASPSPSPSASPTGAPPVRVWADPSGDAAPAYFDLVEGAVGCTRGDLRFRVSIADLDPTLPDQARSYTVYRTTFQRDGTKHFVDSVFAYGSGQQYQSFGGGTFLADGTPVLNYGAQGTVTFGPGAVAEAVVPLSALGITGDALLTGVTGAALDYDVYSFYTGAPTPNPGGRVVDTAAAPAADLRYADGACSAVAS